MVLRRSRQGVLGHNVRPAIGSNGESRGGFFGLSYQSLIDIGENVVNVFYADRQPHRRP